MRHATYHGINGLYRIQIILVFSHFTVDALYILLFSMKKNLYIFALLIATAYATVNQDIFIDKYLDLVKTYFQYRHISVLTHFTCFSKRRYSLINYPYFDIRKLPYTKNIFNDFKHAATSAKIVNLLSKNSFQSRIISDFDNVKQLIDTPHHSTQGFTVDVTCDKFLTIFTHVCNDSICFRI